MTAAGASLGRQILLRLLLVAGLVGIITAGGLAGLFHHTQERASQQDVGAMAEFLASRFRDEERLWEESALRYQGRLQFMRLLEDRRQRWERLTSYLTAQGNGSDVFQGLLVTNAADRVLFAHGLGEGQAPASFAHRRDIDWYADAGGERLWRVFIIPTWLGPDGMGHLILLRAMDNALLARMAVPDTHLFIRWQERIVASSLGEHGRQLALPAADGTMKHDGATMTQTHFAWPGPEGQAPEVVVHRIVERLWSPTEAVAIALATLIILSLAIWAAIGPWLTGTTARIAALRRAAGEFVLLRLVTPELRGALAQARRGRGDQIDLVADSLDDLVHQVVRHEAAREQTELRLRTITDVLAEGLYVLDGKGLVTFVNPETERLLGWTAEELLGCNGHDTFHYKTPDGRPIPRAECPVHRTIRTGGVYRSIKDWLVKKDGSILNVSIVSSPIMEDGEIVGSVAAFHDIAPHLEAERALRESEHEYRTILQTTMEGFAAIRAKDGRFLDVNGAWCNMLGYDREELLRLSIRDVEAQETEAEIRAHLARVMAGGQLRFETRHRKKDGNLIDAEVSAHYVPFRGGVIVAFFRDVTERKQQEARIRQLAFHDSLTGLANRRLLLDRLAAATAKARRYGRPLAVMFLDLDKFKQVNDSLGHDAGDELLKTVAARLSACVRAEDLVCRQGGDEFVILLSETTEAEDAATVAKKLLAALAQPIVIKGQALQVTTSIGVAVQPRHGTDPDTLLKNADIALYAAKEAGRNCYALAAAPVES